MSRNISTIFQVGEDNRRLRWMSLCVFVLSHTILTCALREDALLQNEQNPVISSTVVYVTELMKVWLSCFAVLYLDCSGSSLGERFKDFWHQVRRAFVDEAADLLKLCVPSLLYSLQNNFQFVIESSPWYLMLYQSKIISTAFFYQMMLGRRIRKGEWLTIASLTCGMALVIASQNDIHALHHARILSGVVCVISGCLTSGFAGVYFEKILQFSKSSIWMINLQMSLISATLCMLECLGEDTESIAKRGFFAGYSTMTWFVVLCQASAGLSIAAVCRYADNIYKGFAYGGSVLFACFVEYYFLAQRELLASRTLFEAGASFILAALIGYISLHEILIPTAILRLKSNLIDLDIDSFQFSAGTTDVDHLLPTNRANGSSNAADGDAYGGTAIATVGAPQVKEGKSLFMTYMQMRCRQFLVYICETSPNELARHYEDIARHRSKERDRTIAVSVGGTSNSVDFRTSVSSGDLSAKGGPYLTTRGLGLAQSAQVHSSQESLVVDSNVDLSIGTGKYATGNATPQSLRSKGKDSRLDGGAAMGSLVDRLGEALVSTPVYKGLASVLDAARDFLSEESESRSLSL